jgi:hypothetical protein
MKQKRILILAAILALLIALAQSNTIISAQSDGTYDLTWNTTDGGGAASIGSGYTLIGTIGQADAGVALGGGGYALTGGFWNDSVTNTTKVYLPIVLR